MKRTNTLLLCCALIAVLFTSCGSYSVSQRGQHTPMQSTNRYLLNHRLSTQELLGEVEISVEYHKYLGFIRKMDKVNDETYVKRSRNSFAFSGDRSFGAIDKAEYKLREEFPDADYFIKRSSKCEKLTLFLGSITKRTVTYRAYKLTDEFIPD